MLALVRRLRTGLEIALLAAQVDQLEARVLAALADVWYRKGTHMPDPKIERLLFSADRMITVTGTQREIDAACSRLAHRTGACVQVAVVVGRYRRRCKDRPQGGYDPVGS